MSVLRFRSALCRWRGSLPVVVALSAAACTGLIEQPGASDGTPGTGPGGKSPGGKNGVVNSAYPLSGARTLTQAQYAASIEFLLGDVPLPKLPADPQPEEGFEPLGLSTAESSLDTLTLRTYTDAAHDLAEGVFADAARRESLVGCAPSTPSDPCVDDYLRAFGRRAFRRPLSEEELARYRALVVEGNDKLSSVWAGLEFATAGILQSPHFLYRVELGEVDPDDPKRLKLSVWGVASRLSFLLWNAPPDDALLDAAESGELDTSAGLEAEAKRLLAEPRAKQALSGFVSEWLGLDVLDVLGKDSYTFPDFSEALAQAMKTEAERVIADLLSPDRDFLELLTTRETYVNGELATFYGLSGSFDDSFTQTTLPADGPRAGFLTMGAFLAPNARATRTSPTVRGAFVMERLLCEAVKPPPPGVEVNPPEVGSTGYQTMRDWLEGKHQADPACAGCHSQMDPPGFALENFDGIGAYRETDNGLTIDATGDLDGVAYDGGKELGQVLRDDPRTAACVARQVYRHALGHHETKDEAWLIEAISAGFVDASHSFEALVLSLVKSEAFRYSGGNR